MITITTRNTAPVDKQKVFKRFPWLNDRFEKFLMLFIIVAIFLLAPLLAYDHYRPVASNIQAIYCIMILIVAFFVTKWLGKKLVGGQVNIKPKSANQLVEVIEVKTNRAIKREDPEDIGVAYYIDVTENGQRKTLYLWGQYLDEFEDDLFPNTEFTITRKPGSDEFIDFQVSGDYFKEERTFPPFDKAVWKSGNYPFNGQILNQIIDRIT